MTDHRALVLALGDVGALLAFALIGLASHEEGIGARGLLRDWVPIAVCYAGAAVLAHAWTRPGWVTLLRAWLVGITAGVLVRGVALGREPGRSQLQFLAVTLTVSLVLLVLWRTVARGLGWTR